jgi:hypothetical protein
VEGILIYYLLAIWFFVYTAGGYSRYYLLPGINYILKTYYPVYYNYPFVNDGRAPSKAVIELLKAGGNFMLGFQISLIAAIIIVLVVYIVKLKGVHKSITNASPSNL